VLSSEHYSEDVLDFLKLLFEYQVEYLIIGGEAVIYYGYARLTGDIDFFYHRTSENIERLYQALQEFWGGQIPGLNQPKELDDPNAVFQFGVPPNRLDLLGNLETIEFSKAWQRKRVETIQLDTLLDIYFIGLDDLIKNKKMAGRSKDLEDLKYLQALKNKINN
jgi:predicted nucleotidyltransferase